MATQDYKVVNTHAHEISGWKILSRLLHARAPHLGGVNGDVDYEPDTLAFNYGQQIEYFHRIIIRLQQVINLSGEIFSPTRLIFQYMKALSKGDKIKAFIAPNITDLIIFLDNNKNRLSTQGEIFMDSIVI